MTGNTFIALTSLFVVGVVRGVLHMLLMTRHTGILKFFLSLEPVAPAARMASNTVDLACLHAGAHEPRGIGVILSQVTAIGVKVRILQCRDIILVEEAVTWLPPLR